MRAVGRICQLVEGMPLALELAAAWTRTLSCLEIAHELEQGLTVLTTTSSTVSERHRSIRVVCEHSWNLLTKDEQAVFRCLSVFYGGFRRGAAEQIAGATLPILAALIDKSLLRKRVVEGYEMHDLIRQYAAVKLQELAEEQATACDRHCHYYIDMLFQREEHLRGKRQDEVLAEIRAEMENVRFAWHWAVIHRKLSAIQRAQQGLSDVYDILGWFEEGAELFGEAAERLEGERKETEETEEERVVRGQLYARQGWFCLASGQYEQAQTVVHKSLALLHGAGRGEALLFPLTSLGMVAYLKGDYIEARHRFEESLKLQRSLGNTWGEGWALGHVGMVLCAQGQMQEASALIQDALVCSQALGDRRLTALCLGFLSQVTAMLGNAAHAHALAQESYGLCKDIGYLWGIASALSHVGTATALMGEYGQAHHWHQESLDVFRIIGDPLGRAKTLTYLAQDSWALGAYQQATQHALEAAELALRAQLFPVMLDLLVVLARILSQESNAPLAVEVLGLPLHHAASQHETKDKAHQLLLQLSPHLSPNVLTTIKDHWLEGTPQESMKKAMAFLRGGESPTRSM
jgi:tetratricopeptide (TPR) repeat protein